MINRNIPWLAQFYPDQQMIRISIVIVGSLKIWLLLLRYLRVKHNNIYDLTLICRLLGTPTEKVWPGVSELKDWHIFPKWEPQNLARAVPSLGPDGVDLLSVLIIKHIALIKH